MTDMKDYDLAFEAFLEGESYDAAAEALYDVASKAFEAGWRAAGGNLLPRRSTQEERFAFWRELLQRDK